MNPRPFLAVLLAFGLAACNQTATGPDGAPLPLASVAPMPGTAGPAPVGIGGPAVAAPPGTGTAVAAAPPDPGCRDQVAEFQELLRRDVASGNLKRDVYGRAVADVKQAENACEAGRTVQARSILVSAKRAYGYPA